MRKAPVVSVGVALLVVLVSTAAKLVKPFANGIAAKFVSQIGFVTGAKRMVCNPMRKYFGSSPSPPFARAI